MYLSPSVPPHLFCARVVMQVEYDQEEVSARLSWERKEVEIPGGKEEVVYSVLVCSDEKQEGKEVYG